MTRFLRWLSAISIVSLVAFVLFWSGPALADAVTPLTTDSNSIAQLKLSPIFFSMITAQFVPVLTGYLTKLAMASWQKSLVTLLLSAIQAIVGAFVFVGGSYVLTKETLITTFGAWVVSNVTYSSFWKKAGITSSAVALPDPATPGGQINAPGKLSGVGVTG